MDIGIFIEYNGRVVQIPVNPPSFNVNTEGNNDTVEIITLGEVALPRKAKLSSISWECFFPHDNWYPAIRTKGKFESGAFYVNFINKIRDDCKPCHLTVTGIGFDDDVVIDSFDYYHQAGDHEDTYYSIKLRKYRPFTVSVIPTWSAVKQIKKVSLGTAPANTSVVPVAKEITVGCDVILNGRVHYDSYGSKPGKTFTNYKGKVNLVNKKGSHPYHVTTPSGGWLGWVTKESVVLA